MAFNGESGRLQASRPGHTVYPNSAQVNVKLERFSFLTAFVRRRSEAVLPPWRRELLAEQTVAF